MSTLARSNASLYGTKEDLYDRLKRHAYTGKKGISNSQSKLAKFIKKNYFTFAEKSDSDSEVQ